MEFGVFWFVTVIWLAQNIFNWGISYSNNLYLLVLLIIISYATQQIHIPLPWNIQVVPIAIVYIWIGFLLRKIFTPEYYTNNRTANLLISILVLCAIFLFREILTLDIKYNNLGVPVFSLISSVAASIAVASISMELSKIKWSCKFLVYIGSASMVIMYLHQSVKYLILKDIALGGIFFSLVISLAIYTLMSKFVLTRRLI